MWVVQVLQAILHFMGIAATSAVSWIRENAFRIARLTRALAVWAASHVAARAALVTAAVAAFEVLAAYLTSHVIVPLADGVIARLIPEGSAGDGIIWMLWDTGLGGRELFRCFVLYVANYTLMWRAFSAWVQASAISLATYRASLRSAKAIRDSTI